MTGAAWSCFTHAAALLDTAKYGDVLGQSYEYDSQVINHSAVAVGDLLILRDAQLILGFAVVEQITTRDAVKAMLRCPSCRRSDVAARRRLTPIYRCNDCKATFDHPEPDEVAVTVHTAWYTSHWYELEQPVPIRVLDDVYAGRDQQNAIRRLNPVAAQALLRTITDVEGYLQLEILAHRDGIEGGHIEALVRRRVGQRAFRDRLLQRYGPTCAVTGVQPADVLDAAHLYSYAIREVHEQDGGLLLRADVHRMFDRLLLTFDPKSWQSLVAPRLLELHPNLRALDGREMALPRRDRPRRDLIEEHHHAARERWKAAG